MKYFFIIFIAQFLLAQKLIAQFDKKTGEYKMIFYCHDKLNFRTGSQIDEIQSMPVWMYNSRYNVDLNELFQPPTHHQYGFVLVIDLSRDNDNSYEQIIIPIKYSEISRGSIIGSNPITNSNVRLRSASKGIYDGSRLAKFEGYLNAKGNRISIQTKIVCFY